MADMWQITSGEDKNLSLFSLLLLKNKNKVTHFIYINKHIACLLFGYCHFRTGTARI